MKNHPLKTTWNLTHLYKNDNDLQMQKDRVEIEKKNKQFEKKWRNKTNYLKDPKVLRLALDDYEEWNRNYDGGGKEWYYFQLLSEQDQSNPDIRARFTQVNYFRSKMENQIRFFVLSLSKIPQEKQILFLRDPELKKYSHFLKRVFDQAKHLLSENEEKILNLKSTSSYYNWVKMTSTFLSKEEKDVLLEDGTRSTKPFSDIQSLSESANKNVRDEAVKVFNTILIKHSDIASEELNSVIENKKIDDELRQMPAPDYARHLQDDVDTNVVDTLLTAVSKRFDISAKYYSLKAQLFGVKKLAYHERNVPYGKVDKDYSFNDAAKLISHVLGNLDPEFKEIFTQFFNNGQFDIYPKKGKRAGAFCTSHRIIDPTYILLNYGNKLDDVLTIAHEVGHGINNELIKKKQHSLYFGTPLATAEVASTFMEDFVLEEILKSADDELRLGIMMMKLNSDISTIFRQVACYQFEKSLHLLYREKGFLPKDVIGNLFQSAMKSYMGESVEQPEEAKNWWVYWPHLRYYFYVYSYASGLLISKALQSMVKKDKTNIHKVKKFLSTGLSDSPKNVFQKLRIDIANVRFWENGLKEIELLLNETTQLAKKLNKG